jgi:hypothetical protein
MVLEPVGRVPSYSIASPFLLARRSSYASRKSAEGLHVGRSLVRFGPARAGRAFRGSSTPERERRSPDLPRDGASFLLIAADTHRRRARTGKPGAMYVTVQTALDHATSLRSVFGAFVTSVQSVAKPFICRMSLRKANERPKVGTEIRILDWLFASRSPHNNPTGKKH